MGSTPSCRALGGEEMPRQQRNVLGALAQARQAQADDVEAMVEVLAERALAHALLEVLVRGGDHPHVDLHLLVAADAIEAAVRQHAQQPRLQLRRHVADLVEEQRAALGLLEAAAALLLRAGERAALVAEQLGLEQVLRHRRGVDGDEGLCGARTMPVQRPGDKLLAGAGLAGDQHRDARLGKAADGAENLLHRRRVAEDLGRLRQRLDGLGLAPALVERAPDQLDRLVDVEGLRQVLVGAALERGHGAVEIGVRGHHDHRHRGMALLDRLQQLQPRQAGHAHVGDQHLRRAAGERIERFLRGGERAERDALAAQRLLDHPADGAIVVDDPDRFHVSGSRILNVVRPGRDSNSMTPW